VASVNEGVVLSTVSTVELELHDETRRPKGTRQKSKRLILMMTTF